MEPLVDENLTEVQDIAFNNGNPEVDEDFMNKCVVKRIWTEETMVDKYDVFKKIICVEVTDPQGREYTLYTKDLIIDKMQNGWPL